MLRHQAEQVRETQLTPFGPLVSRSSPRRPLEVLQRAGEYLQALSTPTVQCSSRDLCYNMPRWLCLRMPLAAESGVSQGAEPSPGSFVCRIHRTPYLSPKCDNHVCAKSRASKVSIEYWFPWGMLPSTVVRLQAGYQANTGTLFQLQTFRSVPDGAECINFALNGNIEGLVHIKDQAAGKYMGKGGHGYT
ncbi:hypothetical protein BDV95DRAFT_36436 [Massariosphaeria phaeospora]|uniref:Uncharacterized protein n=1 Tax=Massariosphaeria phaeospora TaxID=100035 RepID=A0A7C8IA76_9PLEO|nr:hypothetical protein BDV95DRAFT_36436 [Massariosphaeria phaeospora]